MDALSRAVLRAGALGLFVYGVLNRVLIVTGLHHILNNIAWFLLGDYHGVTGDLKRFFAGDPSAGAFMAGFFPVMMFGLPAACLAMYHTALPGAARAGRRPAGLDGADLVPDRGDRADRVHLHVPRAGAVRRARAADRRRVRHHERCCGVRLGFGFSAGLFDYVLNFSHATRPLWLLPVGAAYFALYYVLFRFVIVRFDLKTPGARPSEARRGGRRRTAGRRRAASGSRRSAGPPTCARVDACTTRLRLAVADSGGGRRARRSSGSARAAWCARRSTRCRW